MSAMARRRCSVQSCSSWAFDEKSQLCRKCMREKPQLQQAIEKYRDADVLKPGLIVTRPIASDFYLGLKPGDRCDVLDILSDNSSVIVRIPDGTIGYYNIDFLMTEDEVADHFVKEEEERIEREKREAEEAKRRAEEEYEEKLRQRMKEMALMDKERRKYEAEQRMREAEILKQQLEEQRRREEEEARRQAEIQRRKREEEERRKQEIQRQREEEARQLKAQWDAEQEEYRRQKQLQGMPQWKVDLINKRRD